jgi:hypothetical protein
MPRTVKNILEEDEKKPAIDTTGGADDDNDGILVEDGEGQLVVEDKKPSAEEEAIALREQLKKAREETQAESARANEAEKMAGNASAQAKDAFQQQIVTRDSEIDAKVAGAKTALDSVKHQLKQARASGDTDAEVELTDAMTDARYALNAAEWEKKNFSTWKENQKKIAVQQPAAEPASPYTAKELAWIKDNPEFNTNKKFARLAKFAAEEARQEGLKQDSPAYFNYIESALQEHGLLSEAAEPLSGAGTNVRTSVAAAPQRNGGQSPTVGANKKYPSIPSGFRIPADWVQASEDQGFEDPREYANIRLEEEARLKANGQ